MYTILHISKSNIHEPSVFLTRGSLCSTFSWISSHWCHLRTAWTYIYSAKNHKLHVVVWYTRSTESSLLSVCTVIQAVWQVSFIAVEHHSLCGPSLHGLFCPTCNYIVTYVQYSNYQLTIAKKGKREIYIRMEYCTFWPGAMTPARASLNKPTSISNKSLCLIFCNIKERKIYQLLQEATTVFETEQQYILKCCSSLRTTNKNKCC